MALFEKKFCDVCGEKIGMLGNRKLEDGNLCKDCAAKLSPFFSERKHSTVDEIKEQLNYREQNKTQVSQFHPSETYGDHTKVMVDRNMGCFLVSGASNWREKNPDIIPLSNVMNCVLDVKENRTEIYREIQKDGRTERVSFNPPKYEYHYDFDMTISVNHPYFDEIKIDLCSSSERPTSMNDARYQRLQMVAQQIENALLPGRAGNMGGMMGMNNMGMNNMNGMGMNNMGMNNMNGMGMNQQGGMMGAMQQVAAMAGMAGMNNMNQMGNQMGMNNMNGMGMNNMNQMGMNGMNQMGNNMGQMGMNGMNQMGNNMGQMGNQMNQMGMNQMGNNMGQMGNQMNQMGMNGMNQMGNQMNQMGQMGMNGMNQMGNQMNQMGMNQSAPMQQNPGAGQQISGPWTCACGTQNTGAFCEGCGNPRQ